MDNTLSLDRSFDKRLNIQGHSLLCDDILLGIEQSELCFYLYHYASLFHIIFAYKPDMHMKKNLSIEH